MKGYAHTRRLGWLFAGRPFALTAALLVSSWLLKPILLSPIGISQVVARATTAQPQAASPARQEQKQKQIQQIRPENFDLQRFPVTDRTEKHWRNLLWTTAVVSPDNQFVAAALEQILALMLNPRLSQAQMRTVDMAVRVATQLYLQNPQVYAEVGQRFRQAVERSPDPEWVAMSLSGLSLGGLSANELKALTQNVKARFPNWSRNPVLYSTLTELSQLARPNVQPPLADLLNWTIAPGQLQLYVLCRPNRYVLCQTVLKDPRGQFVRQGSSLWTVPLLLRSIHNLSWNFIRGQTPQGLYRIEGTVPQPDNLFFRAYGQFDLVNLYVPFEAGARSFLPGKAGPFRGNLQAYLALLPPSWREYWPLQQSFWAGRIGRSQFRIHGSGDAPDFFSGKERYLDSYNWNPTIGCLSALELYDDAGQLQEADMPKILQVLQQVGGQNFSGYLIVLEIPGNNSTPVSLGEIETAIHAGGLDQPSPSSVAPEARPLPLAY